MNLPKIIILSPIVFLFFAAYRQNRSSLPRERLLLVEAGGAVDSASPIPSISTTTPVGLPCSTARPSTAGMAIKLLAHRRRRHHVGVDLRETYRHYLSRLARWRSRGL